MPEKNITGLLLWIKKEPLIQYNNVLVVYLLQRGWLKINKARTEAG